MPNKLTESLLSGTIWLAAIVERLSQESLQGRVASGTVWLAAIVERLSQESLQGRYGTVWLAAIVERLSQESLQGRYVLFHFKFSSLLWRMTRIPSHKKIEKAERILWVRHFPTLCAGETARENGGDFPSERNTGQDTTSLLSPPEGIVPLR
ncbi:hypothetical protein J6590_059971 [Homalodisca vitripennis]|nr:hypothetical protein J6590_059971 [Homalodisca vitripennis]